MTERKFLAHFIDSSMYGVTPSFVRLGSDLEEYNIELNPEVESKKNIMGEQSVKLKGYEPQGDVDTYYAEEGDALYLALENIVNTRATGDAVKTKVLDVLLTDNGAVVWAYVEDAIIAVKSVGGDTSGYQIPFEVHYAGNRHRCEVSIASNGTVSITSTYATGEPFTWAELASGTEFSSGTQYYTRSGTSPNYVYTPYNGAKQSGTSYYYKNYTTI